MKHQPIAQTETVGDFIARYLAEIGVTVMFGVISIHNMPILDAIARQGRIRFVPARGEAGAMNMADAWARASGKMGVVITSTGTARCSTMPTSRHGWSPAAVRPSSASMTPIAH